ncbi:DUF4886 domain-containing protein [Psychroserpens mesophilus]|uniref:DUF4886 domain-containing protein n=1 Tax=Psychroserpens mesophilus TaxID=325473 RepID=UPI0005913FBC|nr:DUF4886 domain-containing protein [Psychroserpens mesophilus]
MRNFVLIILAVAITSCKSLKTELSEELNVLFIGNSLTYYHEMPQTLQMMLNETNTNIKIDQSTYPGYSLSQHLSRKTESTTEHGIITRTEKKIVEKNWDIIILQTGTVSVLIPENRELKVEKAISRIKELASNKDCKFILFNTWPSKREYPKKYCYSGYSIDKSIKDIDYCSPVMENLEQEITAINESYNLVSKSTKIEKSDNGNKFYEIRVSHPEIELYEDHIHPNKYGAFLNACIFYQILTDMKASELNYNGEIEPKTAELLKKIAE